MDYVRFALPFHTLHYTPHYRALALGLFAPQGVEVNERSSPFATAGDASRGEAAARAAAGLA